MSLLPFESSYRSIKIEYWIQRRYCCKCMHAHSLSCVQLFATPWTVPCQAPRSMRFFRQEYWSGLPVSSPSAAVGFAANSWLFALQMDICIYSCICPRIQSLKNKTNCPKILWKMAFPHQGIPVINITWLL